MTGKQKKINPLHFSLAYAMRQDEKHRAFCKQIIKKAVKVMDSDYAVFPD